jgi:hypothetical protein
VKQIYAKRDEKISKNKRLMLRNRGTEEREAEINKRKISI